MSALRFAITLAVAAELATCAVWRQPMVTADQVVAASTTSHAPTPVAYKPLGRRDTAAASICGYVSGLGGTSISTRSFHNH
jgi:hypothetical protein